MSNSLGIKAITKECDICRDKLQVFDFGDRSLAFDSEGPHHCLNVPNDAELLVIED